MISEKAQKKRDELADNYVKATKLTKHNKRFSYTDGFDQGYQFAKSEAAAEIEKLKSDLHLLSKTDKITTYHVEEPINKYWKKSYEECVSKIQTLEAIIAKLEDGLLFYGEYWENYYIHGNYSSWLAENKRPMSEIYEDQGSKARRTLAEVQAMKEKLK